MRGLRAKWQLAHADNDDTEDGRQRQCSAIIRAVPGRAGPGGKNRYQPKQERDAFGGALPPMGGEHCAVLMCQFVAIRSDATFGCAREAREVQYLFVLPVIR